MVSARDSGLSQSKRSDLQCESPATITETRQGVSLLVD